MKCCAQVQGEGAQGKEQLVSRPMGDRDSVRRSGCSEMRFKDAGMPLEAFVRVSDSTQSREVDSSF